eukprot:scaffold30751_cov56-Attheya_sp.AAC.1
MARQKCVEETKKRSNSRESAEPLRGGLRLVRECATINIFAFKLLRSFARPRLIEIVRRGTQNTKVSTARSLVCTVDTLYQ